MLSQYFEGITAKDIVLFKTIAANEGIDQPGLIKATGYEEKALQASLRKLTGSKLTANSYRYTLVKESPSSNASGFFLTRKGREFSQIT